MAKQIKPQQIIDKIEELIKTQRERGYKDGWVYHQMEQRVNSKRHHISYAKDLPLNALLIARGEATLDELQESLVAYYEQYDDECKQYGWDY